MNAPHHAVGQNEFTDFEKSNLNTTHGQQLFQTRLRPNNLWQPPRGGGKGTRRRPFGTVENINRKIGNQTHATSATDSGNFEPPHFYLTLKTIDFRTFGVFCADVGREFFCDPKK